MKFVIREGFVVILRTEIDAGNGRKEVQENTVFGGQLVDLTPDQAEGHVHKLEPKDKAAEAWLAAKVPPQQAGASLGLTPEALALVQTLASEIVKQTLASVQTSALAPAPAGA